MLREQDVKTLRDAAELVAAQHSASVVDILAAALVECAATPPASNGMGTKQWIAGLLSMGEICTSLAKREEKRLRSYGP